MVEKVRLPPSGEANTGAGRAEGKRQPWHASIPPARSIARRASLPGAGGRRLPLWGGAPSRITGFARVSALCNQIDCMPGEKRSHSLNGPIGYRAAVRQISSPGDSDSGSAAAILTTPGETARRSLANCQRRDSGFCVYLASIRFCYSHGYLPMPCSLKIDLCYGFGGKSGHILNRI